MAEGCTGGPVRSKNANRIGELLLEREQCGEVSVVASMEGRNS
jgi:hypothetical protein